MNLYSYFYPPTAPARRVLKTTLTFETNETNTVAAAPRGAAGFSAAVARRVVSVPAEERLRRQCPSGRPCAAAHPSEAVAPSSSRPGPASGPEFHGCSQACIADRHCARTKAARSVRLGSSHFRNNPLRTIDHMRSPKPKRPRHPAAARPRRPAPGGGFS
jgi:hypothetical protein